MSQVQLETLTKQLQYCSRYIRSGSVPAQQRKANDIPCCALFAILLLIFIGCLTLAIKQGNIQQFLYPTGQGFRCGYGAAQKFPYTYFYNPTVNNKSVCVQQCPSLQQSQQQVQSINCYYNFRCNYTTQILPTTSYSQSWKTAKVLGYPTYPTTGNLCLPQSSIIAGPLNSTAAILYSKISQQHSNISVYDIYTHYYVIIACSGIALIFSVLSHILVRLTPVPKLLNLTLFLVIAVATLGGITFMYQANGVGVRLEGYNGYLGLSYMTLETRYAVVAGLLFAVVVAYVVVAVLEGVRYAKDIRTMVDEHRDIHTPTNTTKQTLIYAAFTTIYLLHWSLCVFTFLYLMTAIPQQNTELPIKMFTEPTNKFAIQRVLAWFVVFWGVWGGWVIVGLGKIYVALLFSENLALEPKKRKNKLYDYTIIAMYHHFGSIVAAAFTIPLIGTPLQFLLWAYKPDITKNPTNPLWKLLSLCNPACYLQISIVGKKYLESSRLCSWLLWHNSTTSYQINSKYRIQMEKIVVTGLKVFVSLLGPIVVQIAYAFVTQLHASIFEILWLVGPGWLIGCGLTDLFMFGLENQTLIREINNLAVLYGFRRVGDTSISRDVSMNKKEKEMVEMVENPGKQM